MALLSRGPAVTVRKKMVQEELTDVLWNDELCYFGSVFVKE